MRGLTTTVCGGALVGLMTSAGMAQFIFTGTDYSTPPSPRGLALGDFDGNGDIDVATTTNGVQASIQFNKGDGTFGGPFNYDAGGTGAGHLIAAPLDGDGDLDLAMVLTDSDQVRIMLNAGDGTFTQGALLNVGAEPTWMVGLKANGDDSIDLAVVNTGAGSVTVLFNNGDGGFPDGVTFPCGGDPRAAAAGDFNHDGFTDLAITRRANRTVEIFTNDGAGNFTLAQSRLVGGEVEPEGVIAGDFDGDTDVDLAVTASVVGGVNRVVVFPNNGGVFGPGKLYPSGGIDPGALVASDLDGDGILDLIAVNRGSAEIGVLRGIGDGTFSATQSIHVGDNPRRVRTADLDGDKRLDIVTSNRDSNNITVLINGGFESACPADLDQNGVLDLFDFLTFQNKFNAQDPSADCDINGAFDLFDFLCFVNLFNQGCP